MARTPRPLSFSAQLPEGPEQHYTVLQIAGAHQFSPSAIVGMIKSGELRGRKAGKEWRVSVTAYRAWLDATEVRL